MDQYERQLMIANEKMKNDRLQYQKDYNKKKANLLNNQITRIYEKGLELREDLLKRKENKEEPTLLERAEQIANENKKIRNKKLVPAREIEVIESQYIEPYNEKYNKLIYYAEKYRLPYFKGSMRKSFKDLAHDIHKYELKHRKKILKTGLDKTQKEYGFYIKSV